MSSEADNESLDQRKQVLRKELLDLNAQRSKIESEIKEWQSILASNGIGMNDSLVDANGFPRNDIDIHQIRIARNKIICLTNDAKNLMKRIEEKLFAFHALDQSNDRSEDTPDM